MRLPNDRNNVPCGKFPADPNAGWWTLIDIAAYTGLAQSTVYKYMTSGRLPDSDYSGLDLGDAYSRSHRWRPQTIVAWDRDRRGYRRTKPRPQQHDQQTATGWIVKPKTPRTCAREGCGVLYLAHKGRFCSTKCRSSSRPKVPLKSHTCENCGEPFESRLTHAKWCSKVCAAQGFHAQRKLDGRAFHMVQVRRQWKTCQCGKRWQASGHHIRWCSNACQAKYTWGPDRGRGKSRLTAQQKLARRKQRRAARGTTGGRVVWAQGWCRRCGAYFVARAALGSSSPAYCSKRHARADIKARRRSRARGLKILSPSRWRVFRRDGWTCQICFDPVNRTAKVPAPDAAVIDHKKPLALFKIGEVDGEHNWQTAHFYCNSLKRDQPDFYLDGYPHDLVRRRYRTSGFVSVSDPDRHEPRDRSLPMTLTFFSIPSTDVLVDPSLDANAHRNIHSVAPNDEPHQQVH